MTTVLNEREEQLLVRIVEGEERPEDWSEWRKCARSQPALWSALAMSLRDRMLLDEAMSNLGQRASTVDPAHIPDPSHHHANAHGLLSRGKTECRQVSQQNSSPHRPAMMGVGGWLGWVAAAVMLAWLVGVRPMDPVTVPGSSGETQIVQTSTSPDEYLRRYVEAGRESGRVIDELPGKVLLDTRLTDDGFEVIYMRQIVERTFTPELYRFTGSDEEGWLERAPLSRPTAPGGRAMPVNYVH